MKKIHLNITDLIIFNAATAIALGLALVCVDPDDLFAEVIDDSVTFRLVGTVDKYVTATIPLPATWTLTLLILRVSRHRLPLRSLVRRPGGTACVAAAVVLAIRTAGLLFLGIKTGFDLGQTNLMVDWRAWLQMYYIVPLGSEVGLAVAASWVTMAVNGRWRPEPGWPDRLGRGLGVYWIGIIPFFTWYPYFAVQ
jgi:hypothetical protein